MTPGRLAIAAMVCAISACSASGKDGEPCDEAEWKGFVFREGSCTSNCLPECSCYGGRWHCSQSVCNDFCGPVPDGGFGCLECGVAPKCIRSCGAF